MHVPVPMHGLLALADQRLPTGGHVHSGGVEQAVADGLVRDVATLDAFLRRRLRTAGLVAAGIAAAAARLSAEPAVDELHDQREPGPPAPPRHQPFGVDHAIPSRLRWLDAAADARTPSPAQRAASRAQGRGLLRLAMTAWAAPSPHAGWTALGPRPHHPVVLGCAAHAAGAGPGGAALVAAYLAVSGPATAAQRLLALDPLAVAAATLHLGDAVSEVAAEAASHDDLPDDSDPLLDLLAERHASREERLFAS
jgi:urease accessory protein